MEFPSSDAWMSYWRNIDEVSAFQMASQLEGGDHRVLVHVSYPRFIHSALENSLSHVGAASHVSAFRSIRILSLYGVRLCASTHPARPELHRADRPRFFPGSFAVRYLPNPIRMARPWVRCLRFIGGSALDCYISFLAKISIPIGQIVI